MYNLTNFLKTRQFSPLAMHTAYCISYLCLKSKKEQLSVFTYEWTGICCRMNADCWSTGDRPVTAARVRACIRRRPWDWRRPARSRRRSNPPTTPRPAAAAADGSSSPARGTAYGASPACRPAHSGYSVTEEQGRG